MSILQCSIVLEFAIYQYQHLLNFTAVQIVQGVAESNGWIHTNIKN
jgi:hypothetical protein